MNIEYSGIISSALIIAVTVLVTFLLLKLSKKLLAAQEAKNGKKIHIRFAFSVLNLFIILLAIATAGSQFSGFRSAVTTILASSGIIALGVSLAAQESLTNIIDGLFISMYKPFNIGDRITLPEKNNLTGFVTEINLRHTVIKTYQNTSYIIPNSVLSSAIIDNSSFQNKTYAYPIDVSVSYGSDLNKAIGLLAEAVSTHPDFVDTRSEKDKADGKPAVTVLVRDFGDSGIELRAQMVTKNVNISFVACSEVRIRLKELFDSNGIVIPYNTVHIDNLNTYKEG